jgi:PAS domain S-box-containing protein
MTDKNLIDRSDIDLSTITSAEKRFAAHARSIHVRTDQMFAVLMILQWTAGMLAAGIISPYTWIGARSEVHPHLMFAVLGGGLLASLPTALALLRPGNTSTRMVISVSQVLFSSLLIHLTGGRIETHFHVFVSLAFLAAYRDWRVLIPATAIVAIDHLVRGIWWPESVFGISTVANWRWLEHAAWVIFEDIILLLTIRQSVCEMHELAEHTTNLEIARKVREKSEKRFRASFDHSAVGMCHTTLDGKFLQVNDFYCQITGYSREELLLLRFQDITHHHDLRENLTFLGQLLAGATTHFTVEKRYVHKQGHDVWVQATVSPVLDEAEKPEYLLAVVQDITEAKAAKELLLASHEEIRKLSLVASKTRHSVVIADADGRTEWVNRGFTKLTGYDASEVIGKKPGELLQGKNTNPHTAFMISQSLRKRESVSIEIINYSKQGREYWISLEVEPVFDNGVLTNFIATQTDVTERKERETQLRYAMQQAESANLAKSQFLANMSHEIRTPLNAIMGFTELMLSGGKCLSEADHDDYLRTIHSSGRHLLELINDVLDLSKIEAGQLQVEMIACSPHQIISETISVLRVRAREKGIALDYRWESPIPECIHTDPHRLKQLLMNLVGNAIKFTNQGSVLIVAELDDSDGASALSIDVRDTGIGISGDKLESIFQPFVQADNTVTRVYGGTGLGLSISRRVAEAIGGTLKVRSDLGLGSVFTIRIPTGDLTGVKFFQQVPEQVSGDIVEVDQAGVDIDGLHVLVVDDGDTNRKLIGLLLERFGAKVKMADNGKVAVQLARELDFDVILMDMQMPVMDGYAATRQLRDEGFQAPIIALTAHAMKGDRERCLDAGCSGYLSKPVDANALYRTMAESDPQRKTRETLLAETNDAAGVETATSTGEIHSLLPTDDPELREIVEEFLDKLPEKLSAMETACQRGDYEALAELAHWLKGAGGTVGFKCFTNPSAKLERLAKQSLPHEAKTVLTTLRSLEERIVV